jgi:transcriptional regulator with XRE-family HTH domain
MSYGTIISNFRRERLRLKQYELADLMKVNVATLSVIENNYRKHLLY